MVPGSQSGMRAEHWSSSVRSFSTKETTMILSTALGCHYRRFPALQLLPTPPPTPPTRSFGKRVPLAPQPTKPTTSLRLLTRGSTHTLGVSPFQTCALSCLEESECSRRLLFRHVDVYLFQLKELVKLRDSSLSWQMLQSSS